MSGLLQNLFKGKAQPPPAGGDDVDFADFASNIPEPPPAAAHGPPTTTATTFAATSTLQPPIAARPVLYTAWYRVWERVEPSDFIQEAFVIPFIILLLCVHVWGMGKNRRKAKQWAQAHLPTLESEFAVVGYDGRPRARKPPSADADDDTAAGGVDSVNVPESMLKEKTGTEFTMYATGRQNVAFLDVSIRLLKWYNPLYMLGDQVVSLFFDSWAAPVERVECVAYAFDGKEKDLVPAPSAVESEMIEQRSKGGSNSSAYDGFVFGIVHKNCMRRLREDRYDISLTFTRDISKLPDWATVMSESAEITEMMLTAELVEAVARAGDDFEYLIITDQPLDKPTKIDETTPRKRVNLSLRLPKSSNYTHTLPLFTQFLRLTDRLVSVAHFRAEVSRKLRNTREEEIRKLRRAYEEEKAEERKLLAEKTKKEERDRLLRGMSAEEQRKYLEKEREREVKRGLKRTTRKG
ncbi:hypothetical protein PABG_03469 [Paracoccidioides brasiliensis Pb03]|uniref:Uncharacterized protein n=1 Tax=Paracoccidioides brasiliensis TaxID=121759 RepID=A0A1D2JCY9_PARBR|nr:hypothetical protein PABG_03469 [Paracoccidioides brasiliensis Pb03]ODH26623.1 hypothetical protein ACO22_04500 [Paracoccidioides brasiliensis]ODH52951.1 hypothetical protein GX48_00819 [Paracoccidioides brasiliensis]